MSGLCLQNKELLAPGRGGTHRDMKVVVQLQRTKAHLPELSITGLPGDGYPDRQGPVAGRQMLRSVLGVTLDGRESSPCQAEAA